MTNNDEDNSAVCKRVSNKQNAFEEKSRGCLFCGAGSWDRQQPAARNRLLSRNEWLRHHSMYIWSSIYGFGAATMWSPLLLAPRDMSSSSFLARWQDSSYPSLRYHQKHVSSRKIIVHILSRDYYLRQNFQNCSTWLQRRERRDAEGSGQAGEEEDARGRTLFPSPK